MRLMTSLYDPMDPMQKPVTRTLRKRTTDTRNAQPNSKRMKNGQPNINYLLEDEEIAEDLKTIQKTTGSVSSRPSTSATSAGGGGSGAVFSPSGAPSSSSSSTSVAPVSLSGI